MKISKKNVMNNTFFSSILKDMAKKIIYLIIITLITLNLTCQKQNIIQNNIDHNNTEHNKNLDKVEKNTNESKLDMIFKECTVESRNIQYCIELYQPVCGWFTKKPSDCTNIYCRESYANSCFACKDKRVLGFTEGKCKN